MWYPFSQLKMEFDQQQIGGFNQHNMEFSRRKMLTLSTKSGNHVINKDIIIIQLKHAKMIEDFRIKDCSHLYYPRLKFIPSGND